MLTGLASGDFHPICPSLFPGSPLLMSVSTLLAEHKMAMVSPNSAGAVT
jgi:hypothetical protein